MADDAAGPVIRVEYRGRIAIITIHNPKKLGALTASDYYDLATRMNEVAKHDEVFVTVLLGTGRFFSAGADVTLARPSPSDGNSSSSNEDAQRQSQHKLWLSAFVANNLNITYAFAHHPKILVVGLNGPVVGLSAALVGWADFIYCTPHAFLLTPFSALGLVAEGGSSRALVNRLGLARANEALIMSKRLDATTLKQCGFVNEIFDFDDDDSGGGGGERGGHENQFRERVLDEVRERLGEHLHGESLLGIKKLIRRPEVEISNAQSVHEVFAGLDKFVRGIPQEEFRKLASGEKRHKL